MNYKKSVFEGIILVFMLSLRIEASLKLSSSVENSLSPSLQVQPVEEGAATMRRHRIMPRSRIVFASKKYLDLIATTQDLEKISRTKKILADRITDPIEQQALRDYAEMHTLKIEAQQLLGKQNFDADDNMQIKYNISEIGLIQDGLGSLSNSIDSLLLTAIQKEGDRRLEEKKINEDLLLQVIAHEMPVADSGEAVSCIKTRLKSMFDSKYHQDIEICSLVHQTRLEALQNMQKGDASAVKNNMLTIDQLAERLKVAELKDHLDQLVLDLLALADQS